MSAPIEEFNVYDVQPTGDKVLAGSFDTLEAAEAALIPGANQSIEHVTEGNTQVLFRSVEEPQ